MLVGLLSEYPGLANAINPKKTKVLFASPERIIASKIYGGGGYIEHWPEDVVGEEGYAHPMPGNTILELFDQGAKSDPFLLKQLIYGDLLHSAGKDPHFSKLREKFIQNYLPETLRFEESKGRKGVWGRAGESPYSRHDAYIRAKLVAPNTPGYTGWGDNLYSPAQLNIIQKMKNYLATGVPEE